jgi:hypothetical protein
MNRTKQLPHLLTSWLLLAVSPNVAAADEPLAT